MVGLLALGGIAALSIGPYVERRVVAEARARGFELTPGEIDWGIGWVQIDGATLRLTDVRSVAVSIGRIEVDLDGTQPTRIQITNIEATVDGSIATVALELSDWTRRYPDTYRLPIGATGIHVAFREEPSAPAYLDVSGGVLTRTPTGAVFVAERATFAGIELGHVGSVLSTDTPAIALGFGEQDLGQAPIRLEVQPTLAQPTAKITLAPIAIGKLSKPLGVPLPLPDVIASGEANLVFASKDAGAPIDGTLSFALKGYVPPHPIELQGFVFGDTTTFDSKLKISADRLRADFTETKVKAGKFEIAGTGAVVREAASAKLAFDLKGDLPCNALAGAAAESRLGAALGKLVGDAARKAVQGTVTVFVKVLADSRDLPNARLERRIGVGCGLKPLTLEELERLVPEEFRKVAGELAAALPPLPSGLPAAPSALPPFPKIPSALPKIELPFPQLPAKQDDKAKAAPSPSAATGE